MRKRFVFSGHVQGVGFRDTSRRIASDHPVTGTVQNLSDGRVEVIAEGTPETLAAFLETLQQRLADFIRATDSHELPAGEPFHDFRVLR